MLHKTIRLTPTVPDISLHDCKVTGIKLPDDGVEFQFDRMLEKRGNDWIEVPNVRVLIRDIGADDVICETARLLRFARRYCRLFTPCELKGLIPRVDAEHPLELYEEFYECNAIRWTLAILPYRGKGKTKELHMHISASAPLTMEYYA